MSFFAKLLGASGKGGKPPTAQEAIQKLRETEEMLAKKQDFLEKKIDIELTTAKKNGTKNKRGEYECSGICSLKGKVTTSWWPSSWGTRKL